jgi:hypothetical protein
MYVASLFEWYRVLPRVSLWHLLKHMHAFPAGRGVHNDWMVHVESVGVLMRPVTSLCRCSKASIEVK